MEQALRALRIPQSKKFSCILPGHGPDQHPSAAIHQGKDGVFRYMDFHRPADPKSLTLAEVRASLAAGRVQQLRGPSQARWYRRLFWEAGLLQAEVVPLLAPGCSEKARKVAEGFAILCALRGLDDDGPVPFTRDFMGPWCGMTTERAREGFWELRARGLVDRAGRHGRMNLYLPAKVKTDRRAA